MNYLYSEQDKQDYYVQDDVHFSHVLTPLFASFQLPGLEEGTKITFNQLNRKFDRYACRLYKGRFYQYDVPYDGDAELRTQEREAVLETRLPVIMEYFQDKVDSILLPYYAKLKKVALHKLDRGGAFELIEHMHDFYTTAWAVHFDVVLPRFDVGAKLEEMYQQLTGEPDGQAVYELLVGVMNKSLETDRAFWELANEIKGNTEIYSLVMNTKIERLTWALRDHAAGQEFIRKMNEVLAQYGYRTSFSHEFVYETWIENPVYAWKLVRTYLQMEYDFNEAFDALVRRRQVALSSFLHRVPESQLKEEFLKLYEVGLNCWGLDEDHHFYIDAMLPAVYRPVLLNIGSVLAESGVIATPSDIFFLYYEEVCEALHSPRSFIGLIRERKHEYHEYEAQTPVPYLGSQPDDGEGAGRAKTWGAAEFVDENTDTLIKGYAASRGLHTGIVKVVKNQDDFEKLQHGDVLVCKTTTPPWTVLFSVAGAIVTNAGGILSHAGTIAREYEIPAVLGTKIATEALKDGDVVTVNGTEGTVVLVAS